MRDLLGVNVSVKSLLPEDNIAAGFDNVSAALEISAAHLLSYQQAAEKAILAAIPVAPQMPFSDKRTGKQIVEKSSLFKQGPRQDLLSQGRRLWCCTPGCRTITSSIATALSPQTGRYRVTASAYAVGTQGKPLTMALLCRPVRERGSPELRTCRDVPENKPTVFEAEFEMNRECHAWLAPWTLPERYEFFLKKVTPTSRSTRAPAWSWSGSRSKGRSVPGRRRAISVCSATCR